MKRIGARRHCVGVVCHQDMTSGIEATQPKPCPGWAHGDSRYCYPHDPAITPEERRANAVRGGHAGLGKRRIKLGTGRGFHHALALAWNALLNRGDRAAEDWDERVLTLLCSLVRLQLSGWKVAIEKAIREKDARPRTVRIIRAD
jgi:hypothetical protein